MMTMYDQLDPDVVRWDLHLIDVCTVTNNSSPQTVTCYAKDLSRMEAVNEVFVKPTGSTVENDEVIAHALQEELSRLDAAESSGSASSGEKHQKASVLTQDWHLISECQSNQDVSKRETTLYDFEDLSTKNEDQVFLPEIENESAIDGELGKRLNHMVPVPHVPKTNGEIPSADEATSDHQRLLNRLQLCPPFPLEPKVSLLFGFGI